MRPSAARAATQRDHRDCARCERLLTQLAEFCVHFSPGIEEILRRNIFNLHRRRQPVLRNSNMPGPQFRLDPLMLKGIEAVRFQKRLQSLRLLVAAVGARQEPVEQSARAVACARHVMREGAETLQVAALACR